MGTQTKSGNGYRKRNSIKRRLDRYGPLADKLVLALFVHHREVAPYSLVRRLLPMVVPQPEATIKIAPETTIRREPVPAVLCLPDRSNTHTIEYGRRGASSTISDILEKHEITIEELLGQSRRQKAVNARHEACYLLAANTNMSLKAIAKIMMKDHSSVINSIFRHCHAHNLPLPRGATWKRATLLNGKSLS